MKKYIVFLICMSFYTNNYAKNLAYYLNNIHSYIANFSQTISHKNKIFHTTAGYLQFLKPHYFNWVTKNPEQQIIADGKKIYIYDKDLAQITIKQQQQQLDNTPAMFLISDPQKLHKYFTITHCHNDNRCFILAATNQQASYKNIKLTFNNIDQLNCLTIVDALGQKTTIKFTTIKTNPKLQPTNFKMKIPKNVDLIE